MVKQKNLYLNFITFFLALAFIITIFNTLEFFNQRSINQYSDWLINYQGGFTRRGLIGELLFQLHIFTKLPLTLFLYFLVFILYVIFFISFYLIIKKIKIDFLDTLIILSPVSFMYTVMEQKVSGRKDILYLALLGIFILNLKKINFVNQKYFLILLITIFSLTHSGFIFYSIFFIFLFYMINLKHGNKQIIIQLIPVFVSLAFILISLTLFSTHSLESVSKICLSIEDYLPTCGKGYIQTLAYGMKTNLEANTLQWHKPYYFIFYFLAFLVTYFPFFLKVYYSKINYYKNNLFLFFLFCTLATFPLYIIGADYGRYLYLGYISSILIYYHLISLEIIKTNYVLNFLGKFKYKYFFATMIIIFYGFTFTVPHCCGNNFKFLYSKFINNIKKY